jgi:Rps23 Pro-64 3,4-dihydroxylase Tpa1-like proline 4-hydroxylase
LNEDWQKEDGGALRIYPDTQDMERPRNVIPKKYAFIDVIPSNGRLVIFDSTLVHSVEKVLNSDKLRRALTIWILRPENSGVRGELYY